jgi:hypothetical protein
VAENHDLHKRDLRGKPLQLPAKPATKKAK